MPELTNSQLQAAVTKLTKNSLRLAENIEAWGKTLDDEARDTARVAESIGALGVDVDTVAETRELAQTLTGIQGAVGAYAAAARDTAKVAAASHDQIRATHDAFQEAFNRGATDYSRLDRGWLEQE